MADIHAEKGDFEVSIKHRFPRFFRYLKEPDCTRDIATYGLQIGPGWYSIVEQMASEIESSGVDIAATTIKEKFGTLRVYCSLARVPASIEQSIINAEAASSHTCQKCGRPGRKTRRSCMRIAVLCDQCGSEKESPNTAKSVGTLCIDCEWNGHGGDLISMALVGSDGSHFYEVLPCENPTEWVAAHVIPVLGKEAVTQEEFAVRLAKYLLRYESLTVVADWPEDIVRFCQALVFAPLRRIGPARMDFLVDARLFAARSAIPHNALSDAKALQEIFITLY